MRLKREKTSRQLFRRNQVIVTTLAVMIAAAGYLNYAGKKELSLGTATEVGMMELSDEDILTENQGSPDYGGTLAVIDSLDSEEEGKVNLAAAETVEDGAEPVLGLDGKEIALLDEHGETLAAADTKTNLAADTKTDLAAGTKTDMTSNEDPAAASDAALTGLENPGEAVLTSGMTVTDYIAGVQLSREQIRAKSRESLMEIIESDTIDEASRQQAVQNMMVLTDTAEKENAAETLLQAKGFANPVVSVSASQVDVVISASSLTDQQRAQVEDIVKRKTEKTADQIVISLMNLEE